MKTALQTMVIHKAIVELGAFEALRLAKEAGYNAAEISGHFPCDDALVAELCRARDELGMEICALNVVYDGPFGKTDRPAGSSTLSLTEDFEKAVSYAKRLGTKYLRYAGSPAHAMTDLGKVREYFAGVEAICLRLEERGLKLCMHNHDTEFAKVDGRFILDWAAELAPHLCFEFDVAGACHAAVDLRSAAKKLSGRMPLIHFCDVKIVPHAGRVHLEETIVGCPLGEGNVDVKAFVETAMECGNEYFIIEMPDQSDPYASIRLAADNMKALGFAHTF